MKTMIIVTGPIGIGKTWLADKICTMLEGNRKVIGLQPMVWLELQPKMNWHEDYAKFKNHVFEDGRTGREHMIEYIETRRKKDVHYWDRRFIESPLFKNTDIVINDSFRKFEEQQFYLERTNLITIVIAPTRYSIGCMYEGDSGICLPPWGGFRAIDSDTALMRFKDFWRQKTNANSQYTAEGIGGTVTNGSTNVGGFVG